MRRLLRYGLCLCALLLALPAAAAHAQAAHSEYEVKAAFLYNFAKFVAWPSPPEQFALCVLGEDPFGRALDVVAGKSVGDKPYVVRRLAAIAALELGACQILFIAASEQAQVGRIVEMTRELPILTVGDTEGYARQGVMINFYLEQDKVRFEINPQAAARSGVRPGAKLLQLGRIVRPGDRPDAE